MVLVPSLFEPCGLSQMIAMRYGALPVVRETGGLRDSVIPYNKYTGEGTGFSFANFNAHELLYTVKEALRIYREDRGAWNTLVGSAMAADFSWNASALSYMALYRELLAPEDGK
ncbi:Glycogen synthase [bioreactor metagenome]|uniref:Glycogen synthase n=1 Tax=bioreactor metagenome TaxID=1076179 RepID=A0A645IFV5_9ZZZZ